MKNVTKVILIILAVLVLLGVLYAAINLVDGPPARFNIAENVDDSSFESFSKGVAGPPNFDKDNGFYRLWTLTEPEGVDIESEEVLLKYRRMSDPQFDNDKYIKEFNASKERWVGVQDYQGYFRSFQDKRKALLKKHGTFDSFSGSKNRDWAQFLVSRKAAALELMDLYKLFLERYGKFVNSGVFEEFTAIRSDIPVPYLLAYLHLARLYVTKHMLEAMDGNWESGVNGILDHLDISKKTVKGSRTLIVNLVAKAMTKESLYALASLMNQPEFPRDLLPVVIQRLPAMKYEEFGTRKPLLLEGYSLTRIKDGGLFYQQNRTRQYYCDFLSNLANSELKPPYQWKSHPLDYSVKKGLFWWLQNPAGKTEFEEMAKSKTLKNLFTTMFKAYSLKAVYDMTRISAELHYHYDAAKSVPEILAGLETYRLWLDPGSGKPYKWHAQKQVLYSFGTDRDDDGANVDWNSIDTDVTLPVAVFIRK
jgi:hypothetical protein